MAYPIGDDLVAFMTGAGVTLPKGIDADELINATIEEWEKETGYAPFLQTENDIALSVPFPSSRALTLPSALLVLTSITLSGQPLTANTHYRIGPEGGAIVGKPFEWIRFTDYLATNNPGMPNGTLEITGKWGRVATIPASVKLAMLGKAGILASQMQTQAQSGKSSSAESGECGGDDADISGPMAVLEQDEVKVQFATSVAERNAAVAQWQATWDKAIKQWRRVTVG
jgi:hypothetical protein